MSWRDQIKVHPAADLLPLLGEDELRELADDVKKHGLRESIVLLSARPLVLLDGRNRLDAYECAFGSEIKFDVHGMPAVPYKMALDLKTPEDVTAFVLSANLHRRHLTPEQRRDLIAKLLKADPAKSNRQIAKTAKASDHTVAAVRSDLEGTAQIAQLTKTTGADGKARPARKPSLAAVGNAKRGGDVIGDVNKGLLEARSKPTDWLLALRVLIDRCKSRTTIAENTDDLAFDYGDVARVAGQLHDLAERLRNKPKKSPKSAAWNLFPMKGTKQ